jgi:hypothetical protein
MKNVFWILSCALLLSAPSYAQNDQAGAGSGSGAGTGANAQAKATTTKTKTEEQSNSRYPWVRTLTNVQIELTLTDQIGVAAPEKKIVSMIVSSGNWGKIRSAGNVRLDPGEGPIVVDLNVDERPYVSTEGPIQLELTINYAPPTAVADPRVGPKPRPSGLNQSLTVVLQSGKPLVISQAADPISDRKVIVEVKATVLK